MSRKLIALFVGAAGFTAYVVAAVTLAGALSPLHPVVELAYFAVAGVLWALPARWLLIWAMRDR